MKKTMLFMLSLLAGGSALAQGGAKTHPANPEAPVPVVEYRSAFADYQRYREQEVARWREINDEVARVGGHIGVLKAERKAGADELGQQNHAGRHGTAGDTHGHGGHK